MYYSVSQPFVILVVGTASSLRSLCVVVVLEILRQGTRTEILFIFSKSVP